MILAHPECENKPKLTPAEISAKAADDDCGDFGLLVRAFVRAVADGREAHVRLYRNSMRRLIARDGA